MGKQIVIVILVFLFINTILLWVVFQTDTPFEFAMWASGILWLNSIPIIHYICVGNRREIFPYMSIVGLFVSLSYSLPVFFIKPSNYEVAPLSEEALIYAFWGYFTFYFIYFSLYGLIKFKKGFDVVNLPVSDIRIRLLALFFLATYFFTRKIYPVPSLLFTGSVGIYIYLGTYLFLLGKKVKISLGERIIYYLVVIEELISSAISGEFSGLALLILYLCIILFVAEKRFGKIIFFSAMFLLFYYFFTPVKHKYRARVWFSKKKYTYFERINIVKELIMDPANYDRDKISEKQKDRYNVLWRPSYEASALSLVVSRTPYQVPFWNGETYILLPKLIPRIIWPDKPTEDASLKFAIKYKLIRPSKKTSPFPLPVLAEMYMNFGEWGILFGPMILAILYNVLNGYFNNRKIAGVGKIYSIAIIFSFIYHEGNLTMTFGNVPLQTFSIYCICRLFQFNYFWKSPKKLSELNTDMRDVGLTDPVLTEA